MLDRLARHAERVEGYSELRRHGNSLTRITMRKGSLIENLASRRGGISARRYRDGAFAFASQPGDSDAAIERCLAEASANLDLFQRRAPRRDGPLPATAPGRGHFDYRSGDTAMTPAERIEAVRAIDGYIADRYPGLVNADVQLMELTMEKALVTSEGAATYSYVPRTTLYVKVSQQANDGIVDLHDIFGGFGECGARFAEVDWLFPEIDRLYARLREKAEGTYCEAGRHDVVLDPDVAGILAHEAIGHTCEADIVLGGSVAGAMLGRQVASEKVTLIDHAERGPDGNGGIAIHVDDEGTPCRDVTIIEQGVLKEFLNNKDTARELGVEPTGNARAYSYSDEPLVRMRNTVIKPGNDKLDDMIAAVDEGYYLTQSSNGQADATSEFMFGIVAGYEIRNGKLGRAIRDTTISGVAFDMLKTVTHVGEELTWHPGGWCGKKQIIPVGMGGPAIKCKITVGGR